MSFADDRAPRGWVLLAAVLTGVQVGAAVVGSRALAGELAPATLALLRYAIALVLLGLLSLLVLRRRQAQTSALPPRERLAVLAIGVLQFALPIVMLNAALHHIGAGLATLLWSTFPALTLALAVAFGLERWRPGVALGIAACSAGVAVALGGGAANAVGPHPSALALGAALSLGAALAGAIAALVVRPYLARHGGVSVGLWAMAATVLALLLPAWAEGGVAQVLALSARGWLILGLVGASSTVGYLLWLYALSNAAPSRVTAFLALAPLTAAALGAAWLGEPWTLALALGLAGVLLGLWLATRR